ncbi:MAG: response regulator, partial [Cyanobacteria bacterium J06555_13]
NILETHHYRVLMAVNGMDAIAQYTPSLPEIDVVLMDVTTPPLAGQSEGQSEDQSEGQSGSTSSLQMLRNLNPEIKVIITSGLPQNEQITAQPGVAAFLQKPYTLATLLKTLRQAIET